MRILLALLISFNCFSQTPTLEERFDALKDKRGAMRESGLTLTYPNPAKLKRKIIEENNTALMEQLEAGDVVFDSKITEKKEKENIKKNEIEGCTAILRSFADIDNLSSSESKLAIGCIIRILR